jgi:hypothetical protein
MRLIGWSMLPALALVLLAAHLFHAGAIVLAILPLLLIGLLFVRRWWAARILQFVLAVATIEWVLTAITLARLRAAHGEPYVRLVAILGTVALFTALAAFVPQRTSLRRWFGLSPRRSQAPSALD